MSSFMSSILHLVGFGSNDSTSMNIKENISLDRSSVDTVSRCHAELREIVHHKFQCEISFEGVDIQGNSKFIKRKKAPDPPAKRFEVDLPSNVRVSVLKGDLTELKVDAVVNAANTQLKHFGGLAAALSKAGGPLIERESNDYIRRHGQLDVGEAIKCKAGNLPCRNLIHAVGPHVTHSSGVNKARPLLEKTIRSILDLVAKYQMSSVAIPAISSGLFNYPLADCADTIVKTVKNYCQVPKFCTAVEILLVNHDERTVAEMARACHEILGTQSMSYSRAVSSDTRGAANAPPDTVQIGKVLVTLKSDLIEEQQTDVIVNTTSSHRDLNSGMISSALLQKAGDKMQQEIRTAAQDGIIVRTKPYGLNCKEVFHTFCVEKSRWNGKEILYNSVLECLRVAVKRYHTSVALPAIGTGVLNFSSQEVAFIMCKAVSDFAPQCPSSFKVQFVIFPKDHVTFKAFQQEMRSLQSKEPNISTHKALEYNVAPPSKKPGNPHIGLLGSSYESVQEAKHWLSDLLMYNGEVIIKNNFIQHFGDQEHQQLAHLMRDVSLEEFLSSGHACITFSSESRQDAIEAALQVEKMLLEVQDTFVKEEAAEIELMTKSRVSFTRKVVDSSSQEFLMVVHPFRHLPLSPVKVEKVENAALKTLFDLKKQQLNYNPSREMYQCVPAEFCNMVSHIGFHAEVAPPEAPNFGEGIYFAATVERAGDLWKSNQGTYSYFVVAEVVEGKSTLGKSGLILPPEMGKDSQLYDSVNGGPEIVVIFSGYQALPKYIVTCGKLHIPHQTSAFTQL